MLPHHSTNSFNKATIPREISLKKDPINNIARIKVEKWKGEPRIFNAVPFLVS